MAFSSFSRVAVHCLEDTSHGSTHGEPAVASFKVSLVTWVLAETERGRGGCHIP